MKKQTKTISDYTLQEIRDILNSCKEMVQENNATRKYLLNQINRIKMKIDEFFDKFNFKIKDMNSRKKMEEIINTYINTINNVETTIHSMKILDPDKIINLLLSLESKISELLLVSKTIGEARISTVDIEMMKKKLKETKIKIPSELKKSDALTQKLFTLFATFKNNEFTISDLEKITERSEEEILDSLYNLENIGLIESYNKGDEVIYRWSQ